jgi:hypothetical protein
MLSQVKQKAALVVAASTETQGGKALQSIV